MYETELAQFKSLNKQKWRVFLIVIFSVIAQVLCVEVIGLGKVFEYIGFGIIILSVLWLAAIGLQVTYFKCPRCSKLMITKFYLFQFLSSKNCVHCDLAIYNGDDPCMKVPRQSKDEWFK